MFNVVRLAERRKTCKHGILSFPPSRHLIQLTHFSSHSVYPYSHGHHIIAPLIIIAFAKCHDAIVDNNNVVVDTTSRAARAMEAWLHALWRCPDGTFGAIKSVCTSLYLHHSSLLRHVSFLSILVMNHVHTKIITENVSITTTHGLSTQTERAATRRVTIGNAVVARVGVYYPRHKPHSHKNRH
jgi:hypothetical protein